jgi:hypothetical protein
MLLDLMALTPIAPAVPFRFGTSKAMLRAYRAAIWHWR